MMATLKGKIGPVPVWLLAVLVTVAAIWYFRRQAAASTSNTSGSNTDTTGASITSGADTPQLGTYGNTYITTYADGDTTDPGNTTVTQPPAANPPVAGTGTTPVPPPAQGQKPPTKTKSMTYRVQQGDNLTKIASKEGVSLSALEATNKSVITADARKHGYTGSNVDSHIYSGEQLVIP